MPKDVRVEWCSLRDFTRDVFATTGCPSKMLR